MSKPILINKTLRNFNKKINVDGDKSLSIRFALLASQAIGKSKAYNLLKSDDVISAVNCLKKLGVKIKWNKKSNSCEIYGNGLNSYIYKKNNRPSRKVNERFIYLRNKTIYHRRSSPLIN